MAAGESFEPTRDGAARPRPAARGDRVREFVGAWYERAREALGHGYGIWFDPATVDVVEVALARQDLDEPLVSLGIARAVAGWDESEALTDLVLLAGVLPARVREMVVGPHATAAFMSGYVSVDPTRPPAPRPVGTVGDLYLSLTPYADGADVPPGDRVALVVDVSPIDRGSSVPGVAVHSAAEEMSLHFPALDRIDCVADGRFVALVRPHPGVALAVAELEFALRVAVGLDEVTVSVWVEPRPPTVQETAAWVDRIATKPPVPASARDALLTDVLAASGVAVTPHRRRSPTTVFLHQVTQAWRNGLSMVAGAVIVVVVAVGVADVLGPVGSRLDLPPNSIFGPPVEPLPDGESADPGATTVAVPVTTGGRGLRGFAAPVEPPAAPGTADAVEPAPAVALAPQPVAEVSPAPQGSDEPGEPEGDAPPPDPCEGLEGGRAKACERHQEVGPPGRESDRGPADSDEEDKTPEQRHRPA